MGNWIDRAKSSISALWEKEPFILKIRITRKIPDSTISSSTTFNLTEKEAKMLSKKLNKRLEEWKENGNTSTKTKNN